MATRGLSMSGPGIAFYIASLPSVSGWPLRSSHRRLCQRDCSATCEPDLPVAAHKPDAMELQFLDCRRDGVVSHRTIVDTGRPQSARGEDNEFRAHILPTTAPKLQINTVISVDQYLHFSGVLTT